MSRIKRGAAVIGVGALVAAGFAVVAPSANAAPVTVVNTNPYQCSTVITAGTFNASTTPNYTVTLDGDNQVVAGSNVSIQPSLNVSPANGPVALADYTAANRTTVDYSVNGGAATTVNGAYGPTTAPVAVPANGATPNPAMGLITIPTTGLNGGDVITVTVKTFRQELTSSSLGGQTGGTTCTPTTAIANILTINVLGPAFTKTAVSGQTVTTHARPGATVTVTGTNFGANNPAIPASAVTVGGVAATASTLAVSGGNLTGTFTTSGSTPTGTQTISISNGPDTATSSISILAPAAASPSSATVGLGGAVAVQLTTNTWDPNGTVAVTGGATTSISVNAAGGSASTNVVVNANVANLTLTQGSNVVVIPLTILLNKCYAIENGTPNTLYGNPAGSCEVEQTVSVSITPGDLAQRHYQRQVTATNQAATGPGTSAAAVANANTPTANQNQGNQNVDLGSIETPLIPVNVFGVINDIAVTDTRGGGTGWTLSATMTTLNAGPGKNINANALKVSTTCTTATSADAWEYSATGKSVISGYVDPWASRINEANVTLPTANAGLTPVSSLTSFTNNDANPAINLCVKNTNLNNYGTTGGVFNVQGNLRLTVPAFQATGTYTGIMTVTLA